MPTNQRMYFPPDEQGFNVENVRKALNFLMDKARADTAKQIFEDINTLTLDYRWRCNKCKEYLIFECEHYQALKNKYQVD